MFLEFDDALSMPLGLLEQRRKFKAVSLRHRAKDSGALIESNYRRHLRRRIFTGSVPTWPSAFLWYWFSESLYRASPSVELPFHLVQRRRQRQSSIRHQNSRLDRHRHADPNLRP